MSQNERLGGMAIFCVTVLGLFFVLVSAVPSEFYVSSKSTTPYTYPEYFTKEDVESTVYFMNKTVSKGTTVTFDFSAQVNAIFYVKWNNLLPIYAQNQIWFAHVYWKFWIWTLQHSMYLDKVFPEQGTGKIYLSKTDALSIVNDGVAKLRPVYCEHISITAWITDPNTTRNDLALAWDEGQVSVAIGFGFDDAMTTLNAWEIIARLLTFQSPEIFGLTGVASTIFNTMIALPLWTCIVYLIYRLILMAIPFVGG